MPKISDLSNASTLTGTEVLPIDQGGTTFKTTLSNIASVVNISGPITGTAMTMSTNKLLGRSTAATGAIQEIGLTGGLVLSGGNLTISGAVSVSSLASSGTISGTNKIDGVSCGVPGKSGNSDRYPLGRSQYAFTVSQTNSCAEAFSQAAASTVYTLKKRSSGTVSTICTFTFAASGTVATVGTVSNGAIAVNDFLYIEGPTTADTTLGDINFFVRA